MTRMYNKNYTLNVSFRILFYLEMNIKYFHAGSFLATRHVATWQPQKVEIHVNHALDDINSYKMKIIPIIALAISSLSYTVKAQASPVQLSIDTTQSNLKLKKSKGSQSWYPGCGIEKLADGSKNIDRNDACRNGLLVRPMKKTNPMKLKIEDNVGISTVRVYPSADGDANDGIEPFAESLFKFGKLAQCTDISNGRRTKANCSPCRRKKWMKLVPKNKRSTCNKNNWGSMNCFDDFQDTTPGYLEFDCQNWNNNGEFPTWLNLFITQHGPQPNNKPKKAHRGNMQVRIGITEVEVFGHKTGTVLVYNNAQVGPFYGLTDGWYVGAGCIWQYETKPEGDQQSWRIGETCYKCDCSSEPDPADRTCNIISRGNLPFGQCGYDPDPNQGNGMDYTSPSACPCWFLSNQQRFDPGDYWVFMSQCYKCVETSGQCSIIKMNYPSPDGSAESCYKFENGYRNIHNNQNTNSLANKWMDEDKALTPVGEIGSCPCGVPYAWNLETYDRGGRGGTYWRKDNQCYKCIIVDNGVQCSDVNLLNTNANDAMAYAAPGPVQGSSWSSGFLRIYHKIKGSSL